MELVSMARTSKRFWLLMALCGVMWLWVIFGSLKEETHSRLRHSVESQHLALALSKLNTNQSKLAVLIPFYGSEWPPWMSYLLLSCARNPTIDWIFFIEANSNLIIPPHAENIRFFELQGRSAMAHLFGQKVARAIREDRLRNRATELISWWDPWGTQGEHSEEAAYTRGFEKAFAKHGGYVLTDYKSLFGYVFGDHLERKDGEGRYTHWAWADMDIVWGDLERWIEEDEWGDYDIVSYSFGDNRAAYLRGQFTMFRNDPTVNLLWMQCPLLTQVGPLPSTQISDERCFSYNIFRHNVYNNDNEGKDNNDNNKKLRVKIATKQFAPWDEDRDAYYWFNGTINECPGGDEEAFWKCYKERLSQKSHHKEGPGNKKDNRTPPLVLMGPREEVEVETAECVRWVGMQYLTCLRMGDEEWRHNLYFIDGRFYKQRFAYPDVGRRAFLHFKYWKDKADTFVVQDLPPPLLDSLNGFKIDYTGIKPIVDPSLQ